PQLSDSGHPGPRSCGAFGAIHGPTPGVGTLPGLARFVKRTASKEGHRMRLIDELTMEIQVGADPTRSSVELKFAATAQDDARIVHLSREEARRLAALILLQAARLDQSQVGWRSPHSDLERRSALE